MLFVCHVVLVGVAMFVYVLRARIVEVFCLYGRDSFDTLSQSLD